MENSKKTYTILELNKEIKLSLKNSFPNLIWVKGEVSGFDRNKEKHHIYFNLQEKNPDKDQIISKINMIIFAGTKQKLYKRITDYGAGNILGDGMAIRVLCEVDVYLPNGNYSLIIKDIDPEFTLGKLAKSREVIIKYLKDKKLLEKNKKIILPKVPLNIGLITSKGTDGYHDFLKELKKRKFAFKVEFFNSSMQGEKVEKEVCSALDYFNEDSNVNVIVITRGGGDRADLSWFDNKKIAESIAFSQIPVLTGIGHEMDYTITDMVAHSFYKSPTAVAAFLVEQVEVFLRDINELFVNIRYHSKIGLDYDIKQLELIKEKMSGASGVYIYKFYENLKNAWKDIVEHSNLLIKSSKEGINSLMLRLNDLDPVNIIRRGFSLSTINGEIIKSINQVKKNQRLLTNITDGDIESIIDVLRSKTKQ